VLTGCAGEHWRRATAALAAGGLPIAGYSVGRDLREEDGAFGRGYQLGDADVVLVRPDGFLAWRRRGTIPDATAALHTAVCRALRRGHVDIDKRAVFSRSEQPCCRPRCA
jgi:2,4-dichlorophenol 6-monooxygenase